MRMCTVLCFSASVTLFALFMMHFDGEIEILSFGYILGTEVWESTIV